MKSTLTIISAVLVSLAVAKFDLQSAFADKGKSKGVTRSTAGASMQRAGSFVRPNLSGAGMKFQAAPQTNSLRQFNSSGLVGSTPKINSTIRNINPKGLTGSTPKIASMIPKVKLSGGSLSSAARSVSPSLMKPAIVKSIGVKPFAVTGVVAGIKYSPIHCNTPLTTQLWCHYHPAHCHWWWNYCGHLHTCLPIHYHYWNWHYVTCPQVIGGVIVPQNVKWYLGVKGMLLPGSGLGVDSVATGSPADLAGIRPGMVIGQANGIALADEASMQKAIATSGGVLQLVVRNDADADPVAVTVQMVLVSSGSF